MEKKKENSSQPAAENTAPKSAKRNLTCLRGMAMNISQKRNKRARKLNTGFVAGGSVKVISETAGNLIVNVKETRVAISKEMAQKIMI